MLGLFDTFGRCNVVLEDTLDGTLAGGDIILVRRSAIGLVRGSRNDLRPGPVPLGGLRDHLVLQLLRRLDLLAHPPSLLLQLAPLVAVGQGGGLLLLGFLGRRRCSCRSSCWLDGGIQLLLSVEQNGLLPAGRRNSIHRQRADDAAAAASPAGEECRRDLELARPTSARVGAPIAAAVGALRVVSADADVVGLVGRLLLYIALLTWHCR